MDKTCVGKEFIQFCLNLHCAKAGLSQMKTLKEAQVCLMQMKAHEECLFRKKQGLAAHYPKFS